MAVSRRAWFLYFVSWNVLCTRCRSILDTGAIISKDQSGEWFGISSDRSDSINRTKFPRGDLPFRAIVQTLLEYTYCYRHSRPHVEAFQRATRDGTGTVGASRIKHQVLASAPVIYIAHDILVHSLHRKPSTQHAAKSLPGGIPTTAGVVNLRYKRSPKKTTIITFSLFLKVEGFIWSRYFVARENILALNTFTASVLIEWMSR